MRRLRPIAHATLSEQGTLPIARHRGIHYNSERASLGNRIVGMRISCPEISRPAMGQNEAVRPRQQPARHREARSGDELSADLIFRIPEMPAIVV